MAEILGIIGSGVAVCQLAGEVSKVALKIRALWSEVEDVPDRIQDMLDELDIMDPLVREIEFQLNKNPLPGNVWNDASARMSLAYCRAAITSLSDMVNNLDREIKESKKLRRKIASVKAVLKKDTVRQLERQLKKATRMLQLSTQCYMV